MTCGSCVANVKSLLENSPAVKTASVNLTMGTALVHVEVPDRVKNENQLLEKIGTGLAEVNPFPLLRLHVLLCTLFSNHAACKHRFLTSSCVNRKSSAKYNKLVCRW